MTDVPARSSSLWEPFVVLGVPVTVFLVPQLWPFIADGGVTFQPTFSDATLLRTLAIEVALAALLLFWLARRGWHLRSEVGLPTLRDAAHGIGLWALLFVVGQLVRLVLFVAAPTVLAATEAAPIGGSLSVWSLGAALLINPVFEEVLWLGYAIPTLEQRVGGGTAAVASIALRLSVHFNQGVHALVSVLPVGLVFTAYFLHRRRVWPVVLAHVINNLIGLGAFVSGGQ